MSDMTDDNWNLLKKFGITPDNHMTATAVYVGGCPGLTALLHDERGYALLHINGRFFAGCRNFTRDETLAHWGGDDYPSRHRGAQFVAAINAAVAQ